ncbi:MAG: hypothetical protein WD226_01495 [Planctomycetota bacterium]
MQKHVALALALLALVGCQQPGAREERDIALPPPAPAPWTARFTEPAVLVATRVSIEGPDDLVEHIAASQGEGIHYSAETTPRGFVERYRVSGGEYLRLQLDAWEIVTTEGATVLRRPDLDGPVRVVAVGEVYWTATDGDAEERAPERTWTGERGR